MRVLQLHAGYRTPAGEDTVLANEAAVLAWGGHEVRQHVVPNPIRLGPTIRTLSRSLHNSAAAAAAERDVRDFRPDVVHVHNTWFALSSAVVPAVATHAPIVMTIHNYRLGCIGTDLYRGDAICTACVGRSPIRGVIHGCYRGSRVLSTIAATEVAVTRRRRTLHDHVDRFVAPSRFMADRLLDIGVPEDRLIVKPHFARDPGPRSRPPSASSEVIFIGRLSSGKGLSSLLRAWERFTSRRRDAGGDPLTLSIVGDGPLNEEMREAAPRDVEFTGWRPPDDVMRRLLAARAFVFPSAWYEPFGMVLVEALSTGTPVLTCHSSDAPRIVDAPPELVVPVGDDEALAQALGQLESDEFVDEIGRRNRRRFETTYSESAGLAGLEALYADVCRTARTR